MFKTTLKKGLYISTPLTYLITVKTMMRSNKPQTLTYFNCTSDDVVMHIHNFMHDMERLATLRTCVFYVSKVDMGLYRVNTFALAIIFSNTPMSKSMLQDALDKIPAPKTIHWAGGR